MERKLTTTRLADGKFEKKGEEGREGRKREEEKSGYREKEAGEGKCLEEEGVRGGGRRREIRRRGA